MSTLAATVLFAAPMTVPARAAEPAAVSSATVDLPGGAGGLRLDDFYFDRSLGKMVVPAGRTGQVDLIDPRTRDVIPIEGFAAPPASTSPAGGGATSADAGPAPGTFVVTDRTDRRLYVVDGAAKKVLAAAVLAAGPDYVRYVASRREVWVTEPHDGQIEVFTLDAATGTPRHSAVIKSTSGEFEALAVDNARGRAYSNQGSATLVLDLAKRAVIASWPNGCKGAEGLVLDDKRGFLIVACREGRTAVLDVKRDGARLSELRSGEGIDILAFSPEKSHVYLPGSKSATMTTAALSDDGKLTALGTVPTAAGAHCVAVDDRGGAWVCSNAAGALLYFPDPY